MTNPITNLLDQITTASGDMALTAARSGNDQVLAFLGLNDTAPVAEVNRWRQLVQEAARLQEMKDQLEARMACIEQQLVTVEQGLKVHQVGVAEEQG